LHTQERRLPPLASPSRRGGYQRQTVLEDHNCQHFGLVEGLDIEQTGLVKRLEIELTGLVERLEIEPTGLVERQEVGKTDKPLSAVKCAQGLDHLEKC